MTLRTLRDLVATKIDPTMTKVPSALIDKAINLAQDFIAKQTLCLRSVFETTTYAEQQVYNLADIGGIGKKRYIKILNVLFDSNRLKICESWELDRDNPGWRSAESGTPEYAVIFGHLLYLYPKPNSDNAGKTIQVEVIRLPDELVEDGDETMIPAEYHELLVDYAVKILTGSLVGDFYARLQQAKRENAKHYKAPYRTVRIL